MSHCLEYAERIAEAAAKSRMSRALAAGFLLAVLARPVQGQRDTVAGRSTLHLSAQAVPVVTRATPTAEQRSLTEAYLSQPMLMIGANRGRLHAVATLNFEGLTMSRGELTTGAHGEGYADRRHPHTYLHELLVGVEHAWGPVVASLTAGRGFAPFGSDDPMVRPFQKYAANHHLAQILERVVAVAAIRHETLTLEGAVFNGDEPTTPSSPPRYNRFGDSWASRLTWTPEFSDSPLELSVSAAKVISPEVAVGGGLNHMKRSAVARWQRASLDREGYVFAEWAKSNAETMFGRPAGAYESWLAEAAFCRDGPRLAGRLERTDRPEEERLNDPFRSPNPATDNSLLGVTRWTTATVSLSTSVRRGDFRARPFVEIAHAVPKALFPGSVFDPRTFYGSTSLWMLSAGVRLSVGGVHSRMGRYGAAMRFGSEADDHEAMGHVMQHGNAMDMTKSATGVSRCVE